MAVATPGPPRPRAASGGRIFIIIGAFLAVVAFGAVVLLANFSGGRVSGPGGPTTRVIYAAKDIPLRTQILTTDQLVVKEVVASDVPPGAFTLSASLNQDKLLGEALKLVQNDIAEVTISKDQPLLANVLAKSADNILGAQAAFLPIPSGFVALTIPTGEQVGVAGYPHEGDYISIIATLGSQKKAAAAIVFADLKIIRVGPANLSTTPATGSTATPAPATAQTSGVPSTLTVIATPCQANFLRWFLLNAAVTYVLESYQDYKKAQAPADAACSSVTAAKATAGVKADDILAQFPAFAQALGG